jgi:DNA uptake protein ComE-like DNA-binding protein
MASHLLGTARGMAVLQANMDDLRLRQDNPELFQAQLVTTEGGEEWYFTVYADSIDGKTPRYGIEDEAGKINLNTASRETLLALLDNRTDLTDCLMDYLDADSEPRPEGAEQDYYDSLAQPYRIKNGPLSTLEEVLLVKGFDGRIVFGNDDNRNGLMEKNEDDSDKSFPPDSSDGKLDTGLRGKATVMTYEPDVSADGTPRVNLNTATPQQLQAAGLSAETVRFIAAWRQARSGSAGNAATQPAGNSGGRGGSASRPAGVRGGGSASRPAAAGAAAFTDPSQLLDAKVDIDDPAKPGQKITITSGVTAENLGTVLDKLTCGGLNLNGQQIRPGRVNLNTASLPVLMCLPGLTEQSAQQIVDMRTNMDSQALASPAWVLTQNVIDASAFKMLAPYSTARSYQFRVRSFGYCPTNGRFCVLEATVDMAGKQPRVTYLRDLTALGVPLVATGKER